MLGWGQWWCFKTNSPAHTQASLNPANRRRQHLELLILPAFQHFHRTMTKEILYLLSGPRWVIIIIVVVEPGCVYRGFNIYRGRLTGPYHYYVPEPQHRPRVVNLPKIASLLSPYHSTVGISSYSFSLPFFLFHDSTKIFHLVDPLFRSELASIFHSIPMQSVCSHHVYIHHVSLLPHPPRAWIRYLR